ncbi:MAG TPA: hypothetical protein VGO03_07570 [Acidimicrobiia bacterium]
MLFEDGHWVCRWCGATLDIPLDRRLVATQQCDGAGVDHRVIEVDGRTVHECAVPKKEVA